MCAFIDSHSLMHMHTASLIVKYGPLSERLLAVYTKQILSGTFLSLCDCLRVRALKQLYRLGVPAF